MRNIAVVLFLLVASIVFADTTIVMKVQSGPIMNQPAKSDTLTMKIKGGKARIDRAEGKSSQVIDLDAHKMYMINPNKKQVVVLSTELANQAGDAMNLGSDAGVNLTYKKTGKREVVNGFHCEEYSVTSTGALNISGTHCITTDIDARDFERFQGFAQNIMKSIASQNAPKGIPVRSEIKMTLMGKEMTTALEVQNISRTSIAASTFAIPKEYSIVEVPNLSKTH